MKKCLMVLLLASVIGWAAGPCDNAGSSVRIASAQPGEAAIRMAGQVLLADGRTPAAGVVMYVYQTGSDGLYGDVGGAPRLRAWLRTGADGRYRYDTIRPGPYPKRQTPAHIHIQFWGGAVPMQYSEDLYFEDDTSLTATIREASAKMGRFANVVRFQRRDGVLSGTQDFRLKRAADRFEDNILHGVRACE